MSTSKYKQTLSGYEASGIQGTWKMGICILWTMDSVGQHVSELRARMNQQSYLYFFTTHYITHSCTSVATHKTFFWHNFQRIAQHQSKLGWESRRNLSNFSNFRKRREFPLNFTSVLHCVTSIFHFLALTDTKTRFIHVSHDFEIYFWKCEKFPKITGDFHENAFPEIN